MLIHSNLSKMFFKPLNLYIFDFMIRVLYVFLSYLICFCIFFYHIELIFLFEAYPYLVISYKRFIATGITDLLDITWTLCLIFSTLLISPLIHYHVFSFFSSSWYYYQLQFLLLTSSTTFVFCISSLVFHSLILPLILNFFIYWEVSSCTSLLKLELEAQITLYVNWVLSLQYFFSFFLSLFFLSLFFPFFLLKIIDFYVYFKTHKNAFLFSTIFLVFIVLPPEPPLQFLTIFFLFVLYELFFISLCLKFFKTYFIKFNSI
uniref:Preprotein translocase subunit SecY n=1 Tax=Sporolithon durum TaxID=48970 RepID=V9P4V4_9FLOR|nr:preprotein translocase subunit SecY [Sporolithon durum]AGU16695.1 preprotein translocase subunit SecY [Sporolithon durum]